MTVEEILRDEALRYRLFPVTKEQIFLAHAGVAPLSGPAAERIQKAAAYASCHAQESSDYVRSVYEARQVCAHFLGAKAQEVALLGPTSLGLSLVAQGLDWKAGDEVVFYPEDYPANVYPWAHLEKRGVRLVRLKPEKVGKITPEFVFKHLSSKTRLVALASCHYLTGYRLDYRSIGEELQRRGILFCLDAIQSLGATPIDVAYVDFLSADSHKWLLGPAGAGLFFVKESHWEALEPLLLGSWNVRSPQFIAQESIEWVASAQRYEPGTLNGLGIEGMLASIELLGELRVELIEKRLLSLRRFMEEGLQRLGLTALYHDESDENLSGIVTVPLAEKAALEAQKRLEAHQISVSLRHDARGQSYLRFSPHFYNQERDFEKVFSLLLS